MAYFILGIPVETFEQSLKTIEFARELKPEYAQFSILSPYRGTRLYDEAKAKGWYREVDANNPFDKDQKRPVVVSENWSEEETERNPETGPPEVLFPGGIRHPASAGDQQLSGNPVPGRDRLGPAALVFCTRRVSMTGGLLQRGTIRQGWSREVVLGFAG